MDLSYANISITLLLSTRCCVILSCIINNTEVDLHENFSLFLTLANPAPDCMYTTAGRALQPPCYAPKSPVSLGPVLTPIMRIVPIVLPSTGDLR